MPTKQDETLALSSSQFFVEGSPNVYTPLHMMSTNEVIKMAYLGSGFGLNLKDAEKRRTMLQLL